MELGVTRRVFPLGIPPAGSALAWVRGRLLGGTQCFTAQEPKITGSRDLLLIWGRLRMAQQQECTGVLCWTAREQQLCYRA